MGALFALLLIALFLFGPPIATVLWRRSRAMWIPSALLVGLSAYLFCTAQVEESSGPPLGVSVPDSFVASFVLYFALFNLLIAGIAFSRGRRAQDPASLPPETSPPPEPLPRAIINREDAQ